MSSPERDSRYLALYRRMKRVVDAYTSRGRSQEADFCMADFFLCFDDVDELERHVRFAEEAAAEAREGTPK